MKEANSVRVIVTGKLYMNERTIECGRMINSRDRKIDYCLQASQWSVLLESHFAMNTIHKSAKPEKEVCNIPTV